MTVLLVAPLHKELAFFTQGLRDRGYSATAMPLGRIAAQRFPALNLIVAHGGHGKTQFGVQTQHLLDHTHDVEAVVCVGAAGALAEDLAVGDLVLATATVEHDYTERFSPHPLPRFVGDAALLAALQQLPLRSLPFGVHCGIVASGDEDVIELERAAALRQATEACAVAWEGAGGARACLFSGIAFLELRGITDTADHTAPADFAANLHVAMTNAAALIALWREHSIGRQP
ncbi:MAG TPA: 5'-methylthioadenosine/S-adenosylhomocysteine nucleosidase [Roseiflexaceae bacterium]|nr:5'-methylthioadenosine/S-adenosylhomocysteine nucleosidase [Roseiflexaceae bacterium]